MTCSERERPQRTWSEKTAGASQALCTVAIVTQDLGQLIDEITVDAYGLDEQLMGFLRVFLDSVTLPVSGVVLGSAVE